MVKPSRTGLDCWILSWYGFHEEHGLRNSSNVFPLFQDCHNIKIMPCVEGDRSDCRPEASSIAEGNGGCRGLTI